MCLAIMLFSLVSCKEKHIDEGFYYWRSVYQLDSVERKALDNRKHIYLKVCDIVKEGWRDANPIAVVSWKDEPLPDVKYTPVVFIDQKVFTHYAGGELKYDDCKGLAEGVYSLVLSAWEYKKLPLDEIQIDCDWTNSTSTPYFVFLKILKEVSRKKISVTLRLDQVKNHSLTGVPPVDEGILMAYNMGNLSSLNAENSILSMDRLKLYIGSNTKYPLKCKLALPIFSWYLLYRGGAFKGIFRSMPEQFLAANFKLTGSNNYKCLKSCEFEERNFQANDIIRYESINKQKLQQAKKYILSNMKIEPEIIYFDLSSRNLKNYEL